MPPFRLVDISADALAALHTRQEASLANSFGADDAAPDLLVGLGDGVTVHVWEAGSTALFSGGAGVGSAESSRAGGVPEQIVGSDGTIFVPYAGRVQAAGRTPAQISGSIESALRGKTQGAQVVVSVTHPSANSVTLLGEAAGSGRVPLTARGERILDALAQTGGSKAPVYETRVRLNRGTDSVSVPLGRLLTSPQENLRLRPGDELVLTREPETFTAFGAMGRNAQVPFDAASISLIQALGKAGGLLDNRADPRGVYLFRYEPAALAAKLPGTTVGDLPADGVAAVIYRLDLAQAGSYFLAQDFAMRDDDVLYVAGAKANQLQKFLTLIGQLSQPIIQGVVIDRTAGN